MLYALLGGLGALGILALLVFGHLTIQSVVGIAIALSNAIGLIAGAQSRIYNLPCHWLCTLLYGSVQFCARTACKVQSSALAPHLIFTPGCGAAPLAAAHASRMGWPMPQFVAECAADPASLRSCATMPAPAFSL